MDSFIFTKQNEGKNNEAEAKQVLCKPYFVPSFTVLIAFIDFFILTLFLPNLFVNFTSRFHFNSENILPPFSLVDTAFISKILFIMSMFVSLSK